METVVVGLSGGVDSSVAAYILKEQGYNVVGMFMKNWHDTSVTISDDCPWEEDANDALLVAEHLGIPYHTIDLSEAYREKIVDYMFTEYEAGRTPNPDVLCNREIKFDVFLKHALKLGADYVATGHYCRKGEVMINGSKQYQLLAGKDPSKDQSYFLCQLNQDQLSKVLFPIGELLKSEVRQVARDINLSTANKKDSQGLCFIGKVKLPDFLKQQLKSKIGDIIEISEHDERYLDLKENIQAESKAYTYHADEGTVVGQHNGAHYFTIGQRKGLQVGGSPKPLFVIATDTKKNIIYVGQGEDHPGLQRKALRIKTEDIHWVQPSYKLNIGDHLNVSARIRYRQPLVDAVLMRLDNGLYLQFTTPMKSITPGQFAAWYIQDELIGSGVIFE